VDAPVKLVNPICHVSFFTATHTIAGINRTRSNAKAGSEIMKLINIRFHLFCTRFLN
jgi:hypothetical protein